MALQRYLSQNCHDMSPPKTNVALPPPIRRTTVLPQWSTTSALNSFLDVETTTTQPPMYPTSLGFSVQNSEHVRQRKRGATAAFKPPPRTRTSNESKRRQLKESTNNRQNPIHSPFRSAVVGMMTKMDRKNTSGVTHFIKFREFCKLPPLVQQHENVNEVMMEFIAYMMIHATNVNSDNTIDVYCTHVKQYNVQNYFVVGYGNNEIKMRWESYSAEFQAFRRAATLWYKTLNTEKGKRVPTTTGLLQFLVKGEDGYGGTLNISGWTNKRIWATELLCMFGGFRKGDLLLLKKDPKTWKGKEVRKKDVDIGENVMVITVKGKFTGRPERVLLLRSEVQPIIDKFGNHFDIFAIMKDIMQENTADDYQEDDLLFTHQDGTPILYSYYYRHMNDATLRAGLPGGSTTGHGGRIRLCTLLMIQGHNEVYIMSRGRWKSDCWMIYFRLFTIVPNKNAVSFRLGELNIDLRGYPPVSEFRK